ncbi:hypothetical protein BU16DRAFT_198919 [Lophium mytilinum]|uniref:Secreted protein n=1 Tax=Lophium mytilinum TaxID=390894 RepID=A0A6A6RAG1_9PEZI|nr:hypothetical protein BU16DRAFT_198919 [Lophium mytilinum]
MTIFFTYLCFSHALASLTMRIMKERKKPLKAIANTIRRELPRIPTKNAQFGDTTDPPYQHLRLHRARPIIETRVKPAQEKKLSMRTCAPTPKQGRYPRTTSLRAQRIRMPLSIAGDSISDILLETPRRRI